MSRKILLVLSLAITIPQVAVAQVAPVPPAVETPAVTPAQRAVVEALVQALNAGGGAALDAWIDRYAELRPTKGPESWRDWFGRIGRTSGGLTVEQIDPPRADGEMRVWVRTGRGDQRRRFGLYVSQDAPDRVRDFIIAVWPTPWDGPMIRARATDEELAALVSARVAFGAERDEFSGAALLAVRGRSVGAGQAGFANREAGEMNTAATRFHIGSMGKMFTAVAIARLVEQGRLSFETRLIDVLPDYPDAEAAHNITMAQLLSHTSGVTIPYVEPDPAAASTDDPARVSDSVPAIARVPLAYAPGSRSAYSNEGYTLLGAVIEAVSGQSYYDFVQQAVFDPAGMDATGFDLPGPVPPGTAIGYRYGRDDALGVLPREPNTVFLIGRGGPSGGAYSTVGDLTAFLNAFRDGRLVSPAMVEALLTPEPNGWRNYGKGFTVINMGARKAVGHSGGGPNSGINADAMIVWETGWSYAVAGNYDAPAAQSVAGALLTAAAHQPVAEGLSAP